MASFLYLPLDVEEKVQNFVINPKHSLPSPLCCYRLMAMPFRIVRHSSSLSPMLAPRKTLWSTPLEAIDCAIDLLDVSVRMSHPHPGGLAVM